MLTVLKEKKTESTDHWVSACQIHKLRENKERYDKTGH